MDIKTCNRVVTSTNLQGYIQLVIPQRLNLPTLDNQLVPVMKLGVQKLSF